MQGFTSYCFISDRDVHGDISFLFVFNTVNLVTTHFTLFSEDQRASQEQSSSERLYMKQSTQKYARLSLPRMPQFVVHSKDGLCFLVGAEVLVTDGAHTRTSAITGGSRWRRHKSAPTSANERRETMAGESRDGRNGSS